MGNRSLLCGAATIEVNMDRYDELLHKEAQLEIMENMISKGLSITPKVYKNMLCPEEVDYE